MCYVRCDMVRRFDENRFQISVTRFKSLEVFTNGEYELPWPNGTLESSKSSKKVIVSRRKFRARRWCWNRRRPQQGKKNIRFVVHGWRMYLSTSWRISFQKLRSRWWNIPNPIDIRRRNDDYSDEYKQYFWTYNHWFMDRSEGCHSFWRVNWDYKIPDLTNKNSWMVEVGNWKTHADPKGYQTRQYVCLEVWIR